jgi:hypothetical protein
MFYFCRSFQGKIIKNSVRSSLKTVEKLIKNSREASRKYHEKQKATSCKTKAILMRKIAPSAIK